MNLYGWFIDLWYQFACGAATAAMLLTKLPTALWILTVIVALALGIGFQDLRPVVAAIAATAIGVGGKARVLSTWSGAAACNGWVKSATRFICLAL